MTPVTLLIGAPESGLMWCSGYFNNIGRGATIDEDAQVRALEAWCVAGSARELLEPTSRLWTLPNVAISPHSASTVDTVNGLLTELLHDNLRRHLNGRRRRNVIDKQRGY